MQTAKKLDLDAMQATIRQNWSFFERRMREEWAALPPEELEEAKENLHSFIVQVERRTHESSAYVKEKLAEWSHEAAPSRGR